MKASLGAGGGGRVGVLGGVGESWRQGQCPLSPDTPLLGAGETVSSG